MTTKKKPKKTQRKIALESDKARWLLMREDCLCYFEDGQYLCYLTEDAAENARKACGDWVLRIRFDW